MYLQLSTQVHVKSFMNYVHNIYTICREMLYHPRPIYCMSLKIQEKFQNFKKKSLLMYNRMKMYLHLDL